MPNEANWTIERLSGKHDRELFSCGVESLDNFLRFLATQYEQRNIGRTWVVVESGQPHVIGYYTLSNGALQPGVLPPAIQKKLPRNLPIPIMHLGRLAADSGKKGMGLGEFLLMDALHRTWRQSQQVGIHAVEVRAIDTRAQSFYSRYGFSSLIDDPLHMYLPIHALRCLFP